ncbi:MAG: hypothetical protein AAGD01_05320 [Acidobacteriota bacterium]
MPLFLDLILFRSLVSWIRPALRLVLLAAFALGLVATHQARALPPDGCVALYEGAQYQGESIQLCGVGDHWLPYDPGTGGINWHYRVSSFRCGPGLELVRFVNGNVPGSERMLRCSEGADGLPQSGFDDSATTVELIDVPSSCVRFFENAFGGGASYEICGAGAWWLPYQPGVLDWHYRVSSFVCGETVASLQLINGNVPGQQVALSCAQGWNLPSFNNLSTNGVTYLVPDDCVALYEGQDLSGASIQVCGEGSYGLPYDPGAGVDWHYRVSSFRCGRGVGSARFINGNVPGDEVEIYCAEDYSLPSRFNDLSTEVEVSFGFDCSAWDGSVPAVGSWLRLKNFMSWDPSLFLYEATLGGRYLRNVHHSGKGLLPSFTGLDPRHRASLYQVVESRSSSRGPEVRLLSPPVGMAVGTPVGNAVSGSGNYPLQVVVNLSAADQWLRLAHTFDTLCPGGCQTGALSPPDATLQINRIGDLRACTQSVGIYSGSQIDFLDVKCNQTEVPRYGGDQELIGKVRVEVCQLW